MSADNEVKMANAIGSCVDGIYGGGCMVKVCDTHCKARHGETAHGFCYASKISNDTCMCRFPC